MQIGLKVKKDILFRSWKDLKQLQNRKFYYFITRHLYPFSPYYRSLFAKNKINPHKIKTIEDLKHLPFTCKKDFFDYDSKDLRNKNLDFLLQPSQQVIRKYLPASEVIKFLLLSLLKGKKYLEGRLEQEYSPIFLTATAGTTDQPVPFLYTHYDLENLKIYGRRIIEVAGAKARDRALNVFPYAPHLAFWQTVFAGISSNMFILSTGGGKTVGTQGNIQSMLNVKPQFLIGVPSYVYHILKAAREKNFKLTFLEKIILGAGRIPTGFKKKLASILREMGVSEVKILGTYGFTESRCAWAECPTSIDISSGYHTYPDKEVFEVVDSQTGEVKREGEDGELVYTNIDARGSCVLRYRTGDIVKGGIVYSPCPYCGRTVPRISSDIFRASNIKNIQLSKIKGALVNLNILEHLLDDKEEIDEWQIEIVKKDNDPYEVDELVIYVSLLKPVNEEEFARHLNEKILASTEISFNRINFVSCQEIQQRIEIETAAKAKKIIDKRPSV